MFADRPYDAPSMDDIARRARVAKGPDPLLLPLRAGLLPGDHRGLGGRAGRAGGER
ncbi:hypothetical protein [Streptomyces sp. NPDC096105]|uniref:hypothetical protein n=1 Tax=Streptomyces sp. NPDC096105 TaxID=3366074 RepID=UPI003816BBCA